MRNVSNQEILDALINMATRKVSSKPTKQTIASVKNFGYTRFNVTLSNADADIISYKYNKNFGL